MNFNIFKFYINVCKIIKVKPTFMGLHEFEKYYHKECKNSDKDKMGKI